MRNTQSNTTLPGPTFDPADVNNPAEPYAAWQDGAYPSSSQDRNCALIEVGPQRNHYDASGVLVTDRGAWKDAECDVTHGSYAKALCQGSVRPPPSPPPPSSPPAALLAFASFSPPLSQPGCCSIAINFNELAEVTTAAACSMHRARFQHGVLGNCMVYIDDNDNMVRENDERKVLSPTGGSYSISYIERGGAGAFSK